MKFRTTLLMGILALVGAVLVATVLAVSLLVDRTARRELGVDLAKSQAVYAEHFAQRRALLRTESRVVAEEPRLKAVVATEDVTHETVLGVAIELRRALQSDVFLMTDAQGVLLADVAEPSATGFDMSKNPLIAGALQAGDAEGVLTDEHGIVQMHARRLAFGATTVGVVAIGYRLNDKAAEAASRLTASGVVLMVDAKTAASAGLDANAEEANAALQGIPDGAAPAEVVLRGRRYLVVGAPLAGYSGKRSVRLLLARSLDDALAARGEFLRTLVVIFAIAGLLAALLAVTLSGRLAKPLGELVAFTKHIAAGDTKRKASVTGAQELAALAQAMNEMVGEIEAGRRSLATRERVAKEMEIAAGIQTSILPKKPTARGLEIAASMHTATEVGGDYYDVLPAADGRCWLAMGDVAGHGLRAGLVMMMIQSVIAALVRALPKATPSAILSLLNPVIYQNVRERLAQDEHVTLVLLDYAPDGKIVFAGAHEVILLCRADGTCERIETPGTWLGAMADISPHTIDSSLQLKKGDVLVLYTDGLVEARNADNAELGLDRITELLAESRTESVDEIRRRLVERARGWASEIRDDITVLVVRYVGT